MLTFASRRPLTQEVWVQSNCHRPGICGGPSGTAMTFSPSDVFRFFPVTFRSATHSYFSPRHRRYVTLPTDKGKGKM
jgi:hypothetical protein